MTPPNQAMPTGEKTTVTGANGEPIVITRFDPSHQPCGAVLITPAIATKASFYRPFAKWLNDRGLRVYTFDYQGYGESARTPIEQVEANYLTWANDMKIVTDHVSADADGLPLTWIGHSLGSQMFAFSSHEKFDKAIFTCSGTGYWRLGSLSHRLLAPLLWWVIGPIAVRTKGYFPGKKLKILGDIPGPVMNQWSSWCKLPEYILSAHPEYRSLFANVTTPITAVTFTDDFITSEKAALHLGSFYSGVEVTNRHFSPEELGEKSIGHMGLYYRGREDLWEKIFSKHIAVK